ncbi:MAG: hypothetical protein KBT27_06795 [Prevotellaceae bacterium]|nr:hypothetical protein [Candidatus Faecinaster equi]
MENKLLNPWALDSNGKIVSIEHASKDEQYRCPVCKEPMYYCQKGTGPHAKTDHFKHNVKTKCSGGGESQIHKMAKEQIYEILRHFIDKQMDLPIVWTCPDCHRDIKANLLKRAKDVRMEHDLDAARPDIDLLDENGKPIIAIEIVFTHDVEENTLRFYDNNNIVLIRIIVKSVEDCNDMMQKLRFPDTCNLCFYDDCKRGATMQVYRSIVPLVKKEDESVAALAVKLDNPFDEPITGLPFTATDERNARASAKKYWPDMQYEIKENSQFSFILVPQENQTIIQPRKFRSYSPHQTIEQVINERRKKAIRANYAKKAKAKRSYKKRR